jgi:hypothetical protein
MRGKEVEGNVEEFTKNLSKGDVEDGVIVAEGRLGRETVFK